MAYNWFFRPHFYRGAAAERVFETLCTNHSLVWQRITQDKKSYQRQKAAGFANAKRGDYLIRNRGNIEIEVKCLSVRTQGQSHGYFLEWGHIARHRNGSAMTKVPVFFAFFERSGERSVNRDSLRMVSLDALANGASRPPGVLYVEKPAKGLFIPLQALMPGLQVLDQS